MDRRRLEEAFLQYAILKMASWHHGVKAEELTFHDGLPHVLASVTPVFLREFMQNYSGLFNTCHNYGVLHAVILCSHQC